MSTKKTTDIYLSAALLALGAKLEDVDKTDTRHMEFSFNLHKDDVPDEFAQDRLDRWEKEWANKTLVVNAFEFAEGLKRLKSVVHSR